MFGAITRSQYFVFAGLDPIIPRMLKRGITGLSALPEPTSPATTTTALARLFDLTALRAHGRRAGIRRRALSRRNAVTLARKRRHDGFTLSEKVGLESLVPGVLAQRVVTHLLWHALSYRPHPGGAAKRALHAVPDGRGAVAVGRAVLVRVHSSRVSQLVFHSFKVVVCVQTLHHAGDTLVNLAHRLVDLLGLAAHCRAHHEDMRGSGSVVHSWLRFVALGGVVHVEKAHLLRHVACGLTFVAVVDAAQTHRRMSACSVQSHVQACVHIRVSIYIAAKASMANSVV